MSQFDGTLEHAFADVDRRPGKSARFLQNTVARSRPVACLAASFASVDDVAAIPGHQRRTPPPVEYRCQAPGAGVGVGAAAAEQRSPAGEKHDQRQTLSTACGRRRPPEFTQHLQGGPQK